MLFLKIFNRYKLVIIIFVITLFLGGYFVTDYFYNNGVARYSYRFSTEEGNLSILIDETFFQDTFKRIDENNKLAETDSTYKKISYANIDYTSMLSTSKLNQISADEYEVTILKKYFPNLVSSKTGVVNPGENRVKNYFNLIYSYSGLNLDYKEVKLIDYQNPFIIGGITSAVGLFLICLSVICLIIIKKEVIFTNIEDNDKIYKSIFHLSYWKKAAGFMNNVKNLCMVSLLFSMMLLCKLIPIPSGFGSLGIGFTYLFFATISLIYGPLCGLFIGFCSDTIGYFIHPSGIFFFGYTLDAMLSGFIYGICFYKKRITFANCLAARFFVNIFVNVGLGCLWWKILYQLDFDAYITYMTLTSLPKNVLYLLPQSLLLFIVFKAVSKPLASYGLIENAVSENVKLF